MPARGLERGTESLYRTILNHPSRTVAQLAAELGWTEDEVRVELERLTALRLVQPVEGNPDQVQAVSVVAGLGALLMRAKMELTRHESEIEVYRAALRALARDCDIGTGQLMDMVVRHEGPEAVQRRLLELASSARATCRTLQFNDPTMLDEDHLMIAQIGLRMGLRIQEVRQDTFRSDPARVARMRELALCGVKIRVMPAIPMRLVLFDDNCALVPSNRVDCSISAVELRSPGAVAVVGALFEQLWANATPWDPTSPTDCNGLLPRQQELLRLLAAGYTDDAASRQLGLSLRTVRRLVAGLMEMLEASSRFEAGVNAAKRNWI